MENRYIDISCQSCGAPLSFDIRKQLYTCGHCGSSLQINEAIRQKEGFKKIHAERLQENVKAYKLFSAYCDSCGATIIFEENEALSKCAFCGKSLVRKDYLLSQDMPECVIPFAIDLKEARQFLQKWCDSNRSKQESRRLSKVIDELQGFYLPYQLVYGPVDLCVSRMDTSSSFDCSGFINDQLINCSKQLNNLLLDGMEPYDLSKLNEFDFGYIAGQRVKISDISASDLEKRTQIETANTYTPEIRKVLQSKAVEVDADVSSAFRMPVLLPVYYICKDGLMAAVNGQTGKVSIRALKDSHYYFLPWWLKAIVATLCFSAVFFLALKAFSADTASSLLITMMLALFFIIVTLCYYSDTMHNAFRVITGRKIFTSGENTFKREDGELVINDKLRERKIQKPVFFEKINDEYQPVVLRFATPLRIFRMFLIAILVIFLPVIFALFLNGFDFSRLNLGGSAVWFCIAVPVVPIYLLKFGIDELYEKPWIYTISNGRLKHYRKKYSVSKETVKDILKTIFLPPTSFLILIALVVFFTMVYLTAFGFTE
ncbi:MAG: hypothetical protein K6A70_09310 [Erysipelotrichaceae bacterium]|nr:hypothetical protein [Erysipelotrichaceae bacterium]